MLAHLFPFRITQQNLHLANRMFINFQVFVEKAMCQNLYYMVTFYHMVAQQSAFNPRM